MAGTPTKITDHDAQALAKLLEQYKKKKQIADLVTTQNIQIQDLEEGIFSIFGRLNFNTAVGAQLDIIGDIVGVARTGSSDADYRILILAKIGQNISNGEPERIISIFRLLTGATWARYANVGNGGIEITGDIILGPTQEDINRIFRTIQRAVAGGVRLLKIICADTAEAFAYEGTNANVSGLGYANTAATTGGKYSTEYQVKIDFAYAGNDADAGGYGVGSADPLVGGVYT